MKSVIELEINMPQTRLATLYADPEQNTRWMDDVDRMEPISGQLGVPSSKYRLVPKNGDMVFVATVLARNLPAELHLSLEASNVTVSVKGLFAALSPNKTRLTSDQVYNFKGPLNKVFGFLARRSIKRAQRRHIYGGIQALRRSPQVMTVTAGRSAARRDRQRTIGALFASRPVNTLVSLEKVLPADFLRVRWI